MIKNIFVDPAYLYVNRETGKTRWELITEFYAIVPKFKIGQEVFIIIQDVIRATSINSFRVFENNELSYYCKYVDGERMYLELDEEEIFATKEEAEQKLAELKGE